MNVKKMFGCSCGMESIVIEKDSDNNDVYLTCYTGSGFYSEQQPLRKFFKRFAIAWKILRKGEYRFFEIILDADTAKELGNELKS